MFLYFIFFLKNENLNIFIYLKMANSFPKRYYREFNQKRLERIGDGNNLTNQWILGKERNPYYLDKDTKYVTKRNIEYFALVDWTLPTIRYKYKQLKKEEYYKLLREDEEERKEKKNIKVVRASFLPMVRMYRNENGREKMENYYFLGNFHDYEDTDMPILADFGGKCENKDRNFLECAKRELGEESKHLLDDVINEELKLFDEDFDRIEVYEGREEKSDEMVIFFVLLLEKDYDFFEKINIEFKELPRGKEFFGAPALYKQKDVKSRKYRTSKNLTDFVSFLNRRSKRNFVNNIF